MARLGGNGIRAWAEDVNEYGLTWDDWSSAAGLPPTDMGYAAPRHYPRERQAWMRGEDPTDWRSARELARSLCDAFAVLHENEATIAYVTKRLNAGPELL